MRGRGAKVLSPLPILLKMHFNNSLSSMLGLERRPLSLKFSYQHTMHLLSLSRICILQTQKFCNLCLPKQPLHGSYNLLFLVSPIQNGRQTAVAVSRNTHSNTTKQWLTTYQNQSPLPDLHQTAQLWTPQNLLHENS